jgi:hypothetical protein
MPGLQNENGRREGFSLDRANAKPLRACLRCVHVEQPSNPIQQAA